jgi:hypothetical protein
MAAAATAQPFARDWVEEREYELVMINSIPDDIYTLSSHTRTKFRMALDFSRLFLFIFMFNLKQGNSVTFSMQSYLLYNDEDRERERERKKNLPCLCWHISGVCVINSMNKRKTARLNAMTEREKRTSASTYGLKQIRGIVWIIIHLLVIFGRVFVLRATLYNVISSAAAWSDVLEIHSLCLNIGMRERERDKVSEQHVAICSPGVHHHHHLVFRVGLLNVARSEPAR